MKKETAAERVYQQAVVYRAALITIAARADNSTLDGVVRLSEIKRLAQEAIASGKPLAVVRFGK